MVNILIADDDSTISNMYEIVLRIHGHNIIGRAKTGDEAVRMYASLTPKPDLVIMDHRMPHKNGLEACKEIIKNDKTAKIILASADRDVLEEALKIGVISAKIKPFDYDSLLDDINKIFN